MPKTPFTYPRLLTAILLMAAGLRLPHLDYGLPDVYEEATPMRQAWEMWGWNGTGFDLNPHFFNYPALSFYIQLIGQLLYYGFGWLTGRFASPDDLRVLYERDPSQLVLLARAITVGFGLGAVWVVALLGRRLAGKAVGLSAAALLAVLPTHVLASRTIRVDIPLVTFAALALYDALQVLDRDQHRVSLRCGLWIGLAASSKYTGALLVIPFLLTHLLKSRQATGRWTDLFSRSGLWFGLAAATAVFLVTSPYCLLDFEAFWEGFSYERYHMLQGHFGVDPDHTFLTYARDIGDNFGLFLTPLLLLGTAIRLVRLGREPRWIPLLAFSVLYLGTISAWSMRATHYLLPVFPCLVLFAAQGIGDLHRLSGRVVSLPRWVSIGLLAAVLILPVGFRTVQKVAASAGPDTRPLARSWIESHVPPGALLAMEFYTPDLIDEDTGNPTYWTVRIPMDTVWPERSAPFYDLRWYADFDYVVTSSALSKRYLDDPERYSKQARFYTDLQNTWHLETEFAPGEASGPLIRIFRHPNPASRLPAPPLDPALYRTLEATDLRLAQGLLERLGHIFYHQRWHEKAIDIYRWLITIDPDNPKFYNQLGGLYYESGDTTTALQVFNKALDLMPEGSGRNLARGKIYFMRGQLDSAAVAWERALETDPHNFLLHNNLAALYRDLGEPDRALRSFRGAIRLSPGKRSLYLETTDLYLKQNRPQDAADLYSKALRRWPDDPDFRIGLGYTYEMQGDLDRATQTYCRPGQSAPDADTFARLGSFAYRQGDLETAIRAWTEGLRIDSANTAFHTNLGVAYFQKGDLNRAARIWEQGHRTAPEDPDLLNNLVLLYREQGRLDRAVRILTEALETTPTNPDLHIALADLYEVRGDRTRAIQAYETALHLAPDREHLHTRLQVLRQSPRHP